MIFKFPEPYELAIASGIMWIIAGLAIKDMPWRAIAVGIGFVLFVYGIIKIPIRVKK
jgi:hypothetical protein